MLMQIPELNKIYEGDNLTIMKQWPAEIVDLIVTSPPYDNLREYGGNSSFVISDIAKELWRIVNTGGIVVWIVGDAVIDGGESGTSFRHALTFMNAGFRLHDTMIYEKNPSYPSSNRYSQVFEYMFVFSKGEPKTVNLIKDRPNRWRESFGTQSERLKDGTLVKRRHITLAEYGSRFNIWRYQTGYGYSDEIASKHPAIFPDKLAEDHIISWSKEGDIVLDPFSGSGTTCKSALKLKRNWLGIEVNSDYIEISEERIARERSQLTLPLDS